MNRIRHIATLLVTADGTTVRYVVRLIVMGAAYFGLALSTDQLLAVWASVETVLAALVKSPLGNPAMPTVPAPPVVSPPSSVAPSGPGPVVDVSPAALSAMPTIPSYNPPQGA